MNSSEAKNIDIAKIFTDIVVNGYTINLVCLFMDYTSLMCFSLDFIKFTFIMDITQNSALVIQNLAHFK